MAKQYKVNCLVTFFVFSPYRLTVKYCFLTACQMILEFYYKCEMS